MVERAANFAEIEAVLIDMDGTLVDSDDAVERAWVTWAEEHGVDARAALAVVHGRPAQDAVRDLLPDADGATVAAAAARQLALQYDDLIDMSAATGAEDLIELLSRLGLRWAVVTSADRRLAMARLTAAGVRPPLLMTSEDVEAGKPDPEGYRLASARLGVEPRRCLVVEDSDVGLQAGKAAGAMVAGLKGLPADLAVPDLGELANLLCHGFAGSAER